MNSRLGLSYSIRSNKKFNGSLRLGFITLYPDTFDKNKLHYTTHNGGDIKEKFFLNNINKIDHGEAVSHLVTGNQAVGITEGVIDIGDNKRFLRIKIDKTKSSLVGLITYRKIKSKYFYRVCFSMKEQDDTSKNQKLPKLNSFIWIQANKYNQN